MPDIMRCLGSVGYLGGLLTVPEEFCWSWGQLRELNREYLCGPNEMIHYMRARMSYHAGARNWLAEQMRGEWLLMLDTDHIFTPDILLKMLTLMQQYQVPILSGIYRHKALPHAPVLYMVDEAQAGFRSIVEYDTTVPLFQIGAAGGGCLLIHRNVFVRLRQQSPEPPFQPIGAKGEDMSFFWRCHQAGIPAYATPQVEAHHLMLRAITTDDYVPEWQSSEAVAVAVPGGG